MTAIAALLPLWIVGSIYWVAFALRRGGRPILVCPLAPLWPVWFAWVAVDRIIGRREGWPSCL